MTFTSQLQPKRTMGFSLELGCPVICHITVKKNPRPRYKRNYGDMKKSSNPFDSHNNSMLTDFDYHENIWYAAGKTPHLLEEFGDSSHMIKVLCLNIEWKWLYLIRRHHHANVMGTVKCPVCLCLLYFLWINYWLNPHWCWHVQMISFMAYHI